MLTLMSLLLKKILSDRDLLVARAFEIYCGLLQSDDASPELIEELARFSFDAARAFDSVAKDETLGIEDIPGAFNR